MKVLMISGDKSFGPGHPRYELQRSAVDGLVVMYWGWGSLWPAIPKGHFDIVTAQDPFWRGHFAAHLAWFLAAKLNLQVHTDLSALPWLKRRWAIFNLRKTDSVRVVSEKIKKQVESFGIKVPIHVLPVYIDVSRFKNLARQLHDKKTILWIGRFEAEKDPTYAVHVLKQVREAGTDVKLVMLGAGSMEKELHQLAKNLPVEFPGWQDPAQYLQTADVVLCTSKHESYGASIIEALAAGVPVVAPDVGVAREARAIVVPREELARAVTDILRSGAWGTLQLPMLSKEVWAKEWLKTL